jgi:hypothetical protein
MRMEMKQRNCSRRPQNSNMRSSHSTFRNDLKSVKLAYTLVVLLTFGLIQSGEFFCGKVIKSWDCYLGLTSSGLEKSYKSSKVLRIWRENKYG